jgi:hypothetical protein
MQPARIKQITMKIRCEAIIELHITASSPRNSRRLRQGAIKPQ